MGSGMDGAVAALTVYKGDLIAGGWFTTAGGVSANFIARWDGSAWQPAGGNFTIAGGLSANRIARWNGSGWQPLGSGIGTLFRELIAGGLHLRLGLSGRCRRRLHRGHPRLAGTPGQLGCVTDHGGGGSAPGLFHVKQTHAMHGPTA